MQLVSKITNLCDSDGLTHQCHRQTDRQADRRTTCNRKTALCTGFESFFEWRKGIYRGNRWGESIPDSGWSATEGPIG